MKTRWPMKTLDELAEVKRGTSRHRPRTAAALYGGPHPFIQTADIHASDFRILKCSQSYSDFGLAQSKKWKAGTLCITNAGENTGDCAILGFDACFPDSIIGITPLEGKADVRFLKYSLDLLRPQLRTVTKGATQDNLSVAILLSFPFPAPDLPTQRKIAGILSAYDDLIENNLRRIKILEEMAQSLYREWFVHFRFPGHESARFIDSSFGQIPKGWEVKTIAEICQSVSYGFTASASRESIGPKFLRITDIVPDQIDWANVPFCEIPKDKTAKLLLQPGDIVVARTGATTGYAKRLNKLHPDTVFASYLVRARAKTEVSNRMLGILMESDEYKKFIQTNLSGSAQPQANAVVLTSMSLVVPDRAISKRFDKLVEPIIDQAELLSFKNQNLRSTRDLLLPKLLTP